LAHNFSCSAIDSPSPPHTSVPKSAPPLEPASQHRSIDTVLHGTHIET